MLITMLAEVQKSPLTLHLEEFSGITGVLSAVASASFWFAHFRMKQETERTIVGLSRRVERLMNLEKVRLEGLSARIKDIENFLKTHSGFIIRSAMRDDKDIFIDQDTFDDL